MALSNHTVLPLLASERRPTSGDESKYDKRKRSQWGITGRILVGCAVALALVILLSGTVLSRPSGARSGTSEGLASGSNEAPQAESSGVPPVQEVPASSLRPNKPNLFDVWENEEGSWADPAVKAYKAPAASAAVKTSLRKTVGGSGDSGGIDWSVVLDPNSCNGYFGNGFKRTFTLAAGEPIGAAQQDASSSSVGELDASAAAAWCAVHEQTSAAMCGLRNVMLDPAKVTMSRGGEGLQDVMGRSEDEELPVFHTGVLALSSGPLSLQAGTGVSDAASTRTLALQMTELGLAGLIERKDPYKHRMLEKTRVVASHIAACTRIITEPVIFVTRMEYANLFHTSTDWYNVWQTARMVGLEPTTAYSTEALFGITDEMAALERGSPRTRTTRIPAHVVFVDGHNASPMDSGWLGAFLSINYIKHFESNVCFERTYHAPFGYHAPIGQGLGDRGQDCKANAVLQQFGNDFVTAFGLSPRHTAKCDTERPTVLFVRRVHYLAHPRHDGQIVRRLDNEDQIFTLLSDTAKRADSPFTLVNGLFSDMSVGQQIAAVQNSCIIMGAHGAGLSHILFSPPGTHMFELRPPSFMRPHFIAYSSWIGAVHHDWAMGTSSPNPQEVLTRLRNILADLPAA